MKRKLNKKHQLFNKVNISISIFLGLTYLFLLYYFIDFKLLSNNLFIILFVLYSIINLLLIFAFIIKNKLINKIFFFIKLLFIILNFISIFSLYKTDSFLNKIVVSTKYNMFYLITEKNNNDVNNLGMLNDINDNVISNVKYNGEIKTYFYFEDLYEALINNEVDSILITSSTSYLIENEHSEFYEKYKIKNEIKILKEESVKEIDIEDNVFTIFISGLDRRGNISNVSRSDVNILMTINTYNSQILLNAIPRDYYVTLHSKGALDKLTHSGIYGIEETTNTVSDLLGIKVDYYVKVNFDTLEKIVDILGGISIYSDQDLDLYYCDVYKGYNDVNGACALDFARNRHSYVSGDRHRGENQEEVIKAIINKIEYDNKYIRKYNSILKTLEENIETNISSNTIKSLIELQLSRNPNWNIKTYNLDGSGTYDYTYSYGYSRTLYVMKPDYNTVTNATNLINGMKENLTFESMGV